MGCFSMADSSRIILRHQDQPSASVQGACLLGDLTMRLPVAAANDNHKPAKLLRYCDLKEKHGITFSRRHLRRLEDTGKFPRRIRGRSRAERQGTQSGAGTGRAVLEGSGSDASLHAYPLHSTIKGAHCARSWIWAVARRSVVGRPNEIKGQE